MDSVLERMYEDIEFSVSKEFPQYIVSLTGQEILLCFDKKKPEVNFLLKNRKGFLKP